MIMVTELVIWAFLLLMHTDHLCQEAHKEMTELGADSETTKSGTAASETQQCQRTSRCAESKVHAQVMALVPYNEESIPVLYKPQRQFSFLGHALTIAQDWGRHGVAAVVWDAAIVLCEYLTQNQQVVRDRRVLELGAGTGLVGMVAALAGGMVTSTERAEALERLQAAVSSNLDPTEHHVEVTELDWTHDHSDHNPNFDVILGADIIYIQDTFPDLLRTLLHFTGPETQVLLSCKIRYERDSNFLLMMQEHFEISKVHFDMEKDIHIYSARRNVRREGEK